MKEPSEPDHAETDRPSGARSIVTAFRSDPGRGFPWTVAGLVILSVTLSFLLHPGWLFPDSAVQW